MRIARSFLGQDFIDGCLNKMSFAELTHNVMTWWDESYPLSKFAPCLKFKDMDIDPQENHQIPKENFHRVPLIQELVNHFQEIFCHLSVTQMWLLCKCKSGDGFQRWHQDKLPGISNTIVINLGGSNNDNDNEEDDGPKSLVNKEAALHKEAMGKNCKQQTSAIMAMKVCGRAALKNGVGIGTLVSLKVDYSTFCHAQGLLAIVYRFNADSGDILVCCKNDVVTHDGSSNTYCVPYDKYRVIATTNSTFSISDKLQVICDKVLAGNFVDDTGTQRISFSNYLNIELGSVSLV